ncbi:MAG: type II secretion system protein M [Steroidobacteraceae bacterium]|nr:type II secretion system protein M [Steroidobacteraceae bacterium]MDW8260729.1 type II secretion system protein GspM [Gammaproteobacteria bacterium]
MLRWWRGLASRERYVLAGGAAVAAAILLYALLAPLYDAVAAARERIALKQDDLRWLEAAAPQLLASGAPAAERATRDNALVVVDRAARESGLGGHVQRVEPVGNGQLQATLSDAPFNATVAWLARLRQQHGVRVASISISAARSGPGLVNATVQLRLSDR